METFFRHKRHKRHCFDTKYKRAFNAVQIELLELGKEHTRKKISRKKYVQPYRSVVVAQQIGRLFLPGLPTGHHPTHESGEGQDNFRKSQGSGRVGSGRVGSGRVGSGSVENLTGRVGSDRVRSKGMLNIMDRVGSPRPGPIRAKWSDP